MMMLGLLLAAWEGSSPASSPSSARQARAARASQPLAAGTRFRPRPRMAGTIPRSGISRTNEATWAKLRIGFAVTRDGLPRTVTSAVRPGGVEGQAAPVPAEAARAGLGWERVRLADVR